MNIGEESSKETENELSTVEWRNELTELEMIRAAKMILLNQNPLFYLRKINNEKHFKRRQLKEEMPDVLKIAQEKTQQKIDPISHLRYDNKKDQNETSSFPRPTSIISLLAECWTNESSKSNSTGAGISQFAKNFIAQQKSGSLKQVSCLSTADVIEDEEAYDSFKRAYKQFEKSKLNRNFSEEFLDRVETVFEEDPNLLYLRVFGSETNIDGKKVNELTYNIFDFFEFRKKNDFLKISHDQKAVSKFFKENYYETNELTRTNNVLFYANKLGGNLWKIQKTGGNNFNVWLQKETNAAVENIHFKFGVHFAFRKQEQFNFNIRNIREDLFEDLNETFIFSRDNGGNWRRNVHCLLEGGSLTFSYSKQAETDQAEFSLFLPFSLGRSIQNLLKKTNHKELIVPKGKLKQAKERKSKIQENRLELPEISIKKPALISPSEVKSTPPDNIVQNLRNYLNESSVKMISSPIPSLEEQQISTHLNKNPQSLELKPQMRNIVYFKKKDSIF